jgi:hypothetical protein
MWEDLVKVKIGEERIMEKMMERKEKNIYK